MVVQRMAACCARVAGAPTNALKSSRVLAGNAFFDHGRAARLSEISVTNLNSISVSGKLSLTAPQECLPSTILLMSTKWSYSSSKLPAEGLVTDFVFDGLRPSGALLKTCQVRKQFGVDKGFEVIAGHGGVVVDLAVCAFGGGPCGPAVGLAQNVLVVAPFQHGFGGFVSFKGVELL